MSRAPDAGGGERADFGGLGRQAFDDTVHFGGFGHLDFVSCAKL